jgi:hypothetical protein
MKNKNTVDLFVLSNDLYIDEEMKDLHEYIKAFFYNKRFNNLYKKKYPVLYQTFLNNNENGFNFYDEFSEWMSIDFDFAKGLNYLDVISSIFVFTKEKTPLALEMNEIMYCNDLKLIVCMKNYISHNHIDLSVAISTGGYQELVEQIRYRDCKDNKVIKKTKTLADLQRFDCVECVAVTGRQKNLTLGKTYKVTRIYENLGINGNAPVLCFRIKDDNNKTKRYTEKSTGFNALP